MKLTNLNAADIPLNGKHLIEASAGTGKTYNITRIYLRLLLERELSVEQILLMTFTKDATQELRGRIDSFIRDALANWSQLCIQDSYFKAISERVETSKVQFLLKRALLFLDEAAIFTIHGFCQRALSQHAFASGLSFNATLSTSSADMILEACQDWYRQLAKKSSADFSLIAQFWPQPSSFIRSFSKAINQKSELTTLDANQIVLAFIELAKQASTALADNDGLLQEGLLSHKKADEQEKRTQALTELSSWLEQVKTCHNDTSLLAAVKSPIPNYLLNGNRHPKAYKPQLAEVLSNCKAIKAQLKNLEKNINRANAYQLVREAIYRIRKQVQDKKLQHNVLGFDDLISALASSLSSQQATNGLADTLLSQYPVALVDEFQDTDPEQFSILQGLYYTEQANRSDAALYLIGDPKQAIYGFRGGDIFAYLRARHSCDHHWLMDTNYRSTANMIDAYNHVFISENDQAADAVFGYGIEYQAVKAGKQFTGATISNSENEQALQLVNFTQEGEDTVTLGLACPLMATWCANEITHLLKATPTKPQDIAILVRDNREAQFIKQALQSAGLASVFLSERANLFHSQQAQQLLTLLKGILAPENERQYLAALVSGLLGFNAIKLHQLQQDEMAYQTLKFAFIDYKKQWQQQGFIAMALNLMHQYFQVPELNRDRALTNILHLFEILQSASQRFLQPEELLYWFEQQCLLEDSELEAELRLESDGDLIRVITQHGAKGLEYPIVFIPFASKHKDPLKFGNQNISYLEYHDNQGNLHLSLDGDDVAKAAMADEAYAESIRLLYVAITRAEKRCYLLTAPFDKSHLSPIGKTLQWQADSDITDNLQHLVNKTPDSINLVQVCLDGITADSPPIDTNKDEAKPELMVSKFVGKIERDWWLSSFSALSRNLRHTGMSTPDRDAGLDPVEILTRQKNASLLRFVLAKGAHSGNLLHDILEHADFCHANWLEATKWPLVKYGELAEPFSEGDLIAWLDEIVLTPLVSTTMKIGDSENFCLADIPLQRTLRESEFYFPMVEASIKGLEKLLTDHRNSVPAEGDENITGISSSASRVKLPHYQSLKGMMHGFIDLVFEHQGRFYVCDYKSSHLGDSFEDYHHVSLRDNVENNYYDLQYLIYSLALHRHLKLNLENYEPELHFGGIYYLYLRGMTNNKEHLGSGVYFRKITSEELTALDTLFAGDTSSNATTEHEEHSHERSD